MIPLRHSTVALFSLLVAASSFVAPGCSGTETDNPIAGGQAPDYRSPILFESPPSAPPGCPGPDADSVPPRDLPLWGRTGNYLVGIDVVGVVPRRGLVVIDVSEPAAPRVVAEQPLNGYPRQLLVEGSSATLVLDEFAMFDGVPVPEAAALETQTKLIRFDLSTPSAPRRLAEATLDGEFWQMQASAAGYWVMSGHIDPATQRCEVPQNLCGYVSRDAMVFTHQSWDGARWVAVEQVELPPGRAWLTEAGVATSSGAANGGSNLSFAAFASDGSLGAVGTLPLPADLVSGSPLYFDSEHVGLFSYDLDDGSAAFSLYALSGSELGRVSGLSQGLGVGTHFVPGGVLVAAGNPSEAGAYIDFRDPSALRRTSLPQAAAFLPLAPAGVAATRVLGWRTEPFSDAATFSLWSLGEAGVTLLDSLPTSLAAPQQSSELELAGERVVFSLRAADNSPRTGSLAWDGDALSLAGPISGGYGDQLLAVGDWLYEPDALGLWFGNPAQGSAQRQAWDDGSALDVSAVPGGEARLLLDAQRGVRLVVTRGGVTTSLAVSPGARRLLPAGERLIVLSTEAADQCQQTGLDCSGYMPNLAIVQLEPLGIAAQLPLPELPVPALSEQSRVEQRWSYSADVTQSPVRLGEQRWLLENEYSATCLTPADCAALGISPVPFGQANVATGQLACAPGVTTCPQPAPPTVYGEANRRVFYVLDAATAQLSDPLIVDGVRGTPYALWTRPLFSGGTLLDLHLDPSSFPPRAGGPSPTTSAFLLERYVLNAAGGLDALPVINIPGYPVALIGEADLITLEPSSALAGSALDGSALDGSGQLHRLRLADSGATLIASRALEARVGTLKVVGQTAVYVRGAADACEPVSHVETFALDQSLTPVGSLELPGESWSVVGSDDASIVLQQERAFVRIEIDAAGNPTLASFETAPSVVAGAQLDGNEVRAIGGNQVVRLSL
ncbi:MAG: hypothetical protein RL685_6028 [Pseudomonadota bacterium]|jgi:hypothetical protein